MEHRHTITAFYNVGCNISADFVTEEGCKCLRLLLALRGYYLSAALQVRPCIAVNTVLQCLQSYEANETHCPANDTCPI